MESGYNHLIGWILAGAFVVFALGGAVGFVVFRALEAFLIWRHRRRMKRRYQQVNKRWRK